MTRAGLETEHSIDNETTMDKWDALEREISGLKERYDQQLRLVLSSARDWVESQKKLSLQTASGVEPWATPGTTAFYYVLQDSRGANIDLIVSLTPDKDSEITLTVSEWLDLNTQYSPTLLDPMRRFSSVTEFRFSRNSLRSVSQMRRSTNAVKHSTSDPTLSSSGDPNRPISDDAYGYYEPRRYGSDSFVRRRHSHDDYRRNPLIEGSRILTMLSQAKLVGRTVYPNMIKESVQVISSKK